MLRKLRYGLEQLYLTAGAMTRELADREQILQRLHQARVLLRSGEVAHARVVTALALFGLLLPDPAEESGEETPMGIEQAVRIVSDFNNVI